MYPENGDFVTNMTNQHLKGPNAATGHTSSIMALENSINYALRVFKPALEGRASTAVIKREAEEAYTDTIQDALQHRVWNSGCSSWYFQKSVDGTKTWNAMSYPYSQGYFWYRCLFPVWSDWEYSVSRDDELSGMSGEANLTLCVTRDNRVRSRRSRRGSRAHCFSS